MNEHFRVGTVDLAGFVLATLPGLATDWWQKHVVARLSFQQQRLLTEEARNKLDQRDLAALLRVLDQNWHELSEATAVTGSRVWRSGRPPFVLVGLGELWRQRREHGRFKACGQEDAV